MIELSEAEVKNACEEYLQYAMNQGKLWFSRMNAGSFIAGQGTPGERMIKGAGAGTADLIVIQAGSIQMFYRAISRGEPWPIAFVTFIECKSTKGKTTKEQDEFAEQARNQHCRYEIVRSVDDLMEVLKRE